MTLEEAMGLVTDPEAKRFLEKMIKDQNSYITKLEGQLKDTAQTSVKPTDDITLKYLEKNMKREVIAEATNEILKSVSPEVFNAVKPDFDAFLAANLTKERCTVEWVTDGFSLVLGRCMRNKDHAVNQLGKTNSPEGTPKPQITPGTNGQSVDAVNNILKETAPTISKNDATYASGLPQVDKPQVKNTKDAFASLKERFSQKGAERFN